MTFEKNAQIATAQRIAKFKSNEKHYKAKGIRLMREQGNWLIVSLKKFVSQEFWKAWRTDKEGMKAKGYNVAKVYDHWIVY